MSKNPKSDKPAKDSGSSNSKKPENTKTENNKPVSSTNKEASPANGTQPPNPTNQEKPDKESFRRPNFYKYEEVRSELIDLLSGGTHTAAQARQKLDLSPCTFFKYKALAQVETGLNLRTIDEELHIKLKKQRNPFVKDPVLTNSKPALKE